MKWYGRSLTEWLLVKETNDLSTFGIEPHRLVSTNTNASNGIDYFNQSDSSSAYISIDDSLTTGKPHIH